MLRTRIPYPTRYSYPKCVSKLRESCGRRRDISRDICDRLAPLGSPTRNFLKIRLAENRATVCNDASPSTREREREREGTKKNTWVGVWDRSGDSGQRETPPKCSYLTVSYDQTLIEPFVKRLFRFPHFCGYTASASNRQNDGQFAAAPKSATHYTTIPPT